MLRTINDGGFEGTEGDRYRELINADFPNYLDISGKAHTGVSDAISRYSSIRHEQQSLMNT